MACSSLEILPQADPRALISGQEDVAKPHEITTVPWSVPWSVLAIASSGTGIELDSSRIPRQRQSCCLRIVAAATRRRNTFSSMTYKRSSIRLA